MGTYEMFRGVDKGLGRSDILDRTLTLALLRFSFSMKHVSLPLPRPFHGAPLPFLPPPSARQLETT
jgi:hypothetical protein